MDENVIKSEIEQGIAQVDPTLIISEFACDYDKQTRSLRVFFTAKTSDGETLEVQNSWA